MSGAARLWLGFAAAGAAMVLALAWATSSALALERQAEGDRAAARVQSAARAALWRMDGAIAALLTAGDAEDADRSTIPEPLRTVPWARFTISADGASVLRAHGGSDDGWLALLAGIDRGPDVAYAIQAEPSQEVQGDYGQRAQAFNGNSSNLLRTAAQPELAPPRVVRIGDRGLALVRDRGDGLAGIVIELAPLRAALVSLVRDLLPQAGITLVDDPRSAAYPLAALPLELEPGHPPPEPTPPASLAATFAVAWGSVAVGVAGLGAALAGALALARRREAFASAVTHELRTPITSMRLYADMLGEGMVPEAQRAGYLATIRAEAERLGRLVDNVLAYARVERGGAASVIETAPGALLEACRERLARRAAECGMQVEVEPGDADARRVRADAALVEHVLANLVDNACKYAASGTDRRITLRAEVRGTRTALVVADHGPGLDAGARKRLFVPFSRSAGAAAGSAPGVGLGLALSRAMARRMRGDLVYEGGADGARFALLLPMA